MPTQKEIAEHLGITQQAVSAQMKKLDLDWRNATIDEIRLAYIERLRAEAAQHVSSSGLDLVEEKAKTERITRELKLIELQEKKGQLVDVTELQKDLTMVFLNFKNILMGRDAKLKQSIDSIYGIDLDIGYLNDNTNDALSVLADVLDGNGEAAPGTGESAEARHSDDHDGMG